jgi:hypothetical protein
MPAKKNPVPPAPAAGPAQPPADNPQLRHAAGARALSGREEALQRLRALEQLERMKSADTEETEEDESSK